MNTIWVNNSSFPSLLNCPRQYVYRVIYGLRYIKDPSMTIGSGFHHFMSVVQDEDVPAILELVRSLPDKIKNVLPNAQITRLADLAVRTHQRLRTGEPFVRETFVEIDTASLLNPDVIQLPDNVRIRDAMTLDRGEVVRLGINGEYFLLTDYKTTHKPLQRADLHIGYKLSSQLRFYAKTLIFAARTGQLPATLEPYTELLKDGRIATRYVYVNYTDKAAEKPQDQIYVGDPVLYTPDELDTFTKQVNDRRMLAAFIALNPQHAHKDGIMSGACYKCPYTSICLLGNPVLEQTAVENWALGRAPYDPTHQNS